ncbi:MAG: hypothetical protein RR505_01050, partial [Raoultibacter sp.]
TGDGPFEDTPGISRRSFVVTGALLGAASLGMIAGCSSAEKTTSNELSNEASAEATQTPTNVSSDKVYIVDTFTPKPGDGKSFLDDYMKVFRPIEENAGMTLVSSTVSPPLWLEDSSNKIQVVWTIDDLAVSAWAMSSATRYSPEYMEWCISAKNRVIARDRSYYASEEYMEVLNNV